MNVIRIIASFILVVVGIASLGADFIAPHDYAMQYRGRANEGPSHEFLLGTDLLGRDRLSRLLHGSRISLFCALAAAMVATAIGLIIGAVSGYIGGWAQEFASALTDLFLSVPWLFALLLLRALLPLNVSMYASIATTFLLLAVIGWASGARVIQAAVVRLRQSPAILHARAYGSRNVRLVCFQIVPSVAPVCIAQFWTLVPVFLLTEANLGVLGLGIVEPMPSWGNMIAELQNYRHIPEAPWILVPAVLLVLVIFSLHFVVSEHNIWE